MRLALITRSAAGLLQFYDLAMLSAHRVSVKCTASLNMELWRGVGECVCKVFHSWRVFHSKYRKGSEKGVVLSAVGRLVSLGSLASLYQD